MAYKRRNYDFEQRLCAIADRKVTERQLQQSKVKLSRIARVFDACIRALRGERLHAN